MENILEEAHSHIIGRQYIITEASASQIQSGRNAFLCSSPIITIFVFRLKRILIYLTLVLLLASCCSEVQETSAPTLTELHEVGKLELIEYRTEEIFIISPKEQKLKLIMTLDEVSNYLDNLLTVGDRIGVYSFENFSIAYIDLSQLRDEDIRYDRFPSCHCSTLPAIQIEPIGRSGEIRKLHDRVSGTTIQYLQRRAPTNAEPSLSATSHQSSCTRHTQT